MNLLVLKSLQYDNILMSYISLLDLKAWEHYENFTA